MKVAVELLGTLGDLARHLHGPIQLTLPDEATAMDLVTSLAQRFGEPFAEPDTEDTTPTPAFPTRIQLFVNGEFSPRPDRRLAVCGAESATVQVLIMKPVTGG